MLDIQPAKVQELWHSIDRRLQIAFRNEVARMEGARATEDQKVLERLSFWWMNEAAGGPASPPPPGWRGVGGVPPPHHTPIAHCFPSATLTARVHIRTRPCTLEHKHGHPVQSNRRGTVPFALLARAARLLSNRRLPLRPLCFVMFLFPTLPGGGGMADWTGCLCTSCPSPRRSNPVDPEGVRILFC